MLSVLNITNTELNKNTLTQLLVAEKLMALTKDYCDVFFMIS